ncbi:MAG: aromatic ring-hydroxylating dioxygenase subunit alpha [Polyangiaceae bacterium]|nr:aromatic ring-hydroxylating dioxygenase subunit alpha [Polyangiaceae bacterium]
MFEGFANVWTPVTLGARLRKGKLLPFEIAGTKIVLFRDPDGSPKALVDQCPHRGVALSLGKIASDGCIECPFHGWRFDGKGNTCAVPWNPEAKLDKLHAQPVPALERAGLVWVYTDVGVSASHEPEISDMLLRENTRVTTVEIDWKTHWTRAMENMLDWPHLPFVHAKTIGKGMLASSNARMDVHWEERPWGAHSSISIDGKPHAGSLDFRWPNMMNLFIPIPENKLVLAAACVPVNKTTTRMVLVNYRRFMLSPLFDPFFDIMNKRIATEDQAIVESSNPPEIPPARDEQSVRTDALTLAFRKRYFNELRDSAVTPAPRRGALPVLRPIAAE